MTTNQSDITTRLRTWTHAVGAAPASDLMDEAADEIDRLRDRLASIATCDNDRPEAIAGCDCPVADNAPKQDTTPAQGSVPPECATAPGWMARPFWVDPPAGHRYGFPKLYDRAFDGDMTEWMIRNGYPEHLARKNMPCTFTATTE